MPAPRRGEVWLVDLGMAAKVRPAVVVSIPADERDRALVTLVPHTTSLRQSRFEAKRLVERRDESYAYFNGAGYRPLQPTSGARVVGLIPTSVSAARG